MSVTVIPLYKPLDLKYTNMVGRGLFSNVWKWQVAVKSPHLRDDTRQIDREEQVYERLGDHIGLLKYHGRLRDCLLLSMAEKGTIREYYAWERPAWTVDLHTKLVWIGELIECMVHIHSKGVYHGDLSANNVLLDRSLHVKICDFGSAVVESQEPLGCYEVTHCLPKHKTPNAASDLFALGSTIYDILVGERPYPGPDRDRVELYFEAGHFADLSNVPACSHIIHKCWHEQYTSAEELSHDFAAEVRKHRQKHSRIRSLMNRACAYIWSFYHGHTLHTRSVSSRLSLPLLLPVPILAALGMAVAWRQKLLLNHTG